MRLINVMQWMQSVLQMQSQPKADAKPRRYVIVAKEGMRWLKPNELGAAKSLGDFRNIKPSE